jgi:hypothetical protein
MRGGRTGSVRKYEIDSSHIVYLELRKRDPVVQDSGCPRRTAGRQPAPTLKLTDYQATRSGEKESNETFTRRPRKRLNSVSTPKLSAALMMRCSE